MGAYIYFMWLLGIIVIFLLYKTIVYNNKFATLFENHRNNKDLFKTLVLRLSEKDLEIKSINSNMIRSKETITKLSAQIKVLNSKNFNESRHITTKKTINNDNLGKSTK